MTQPREPSPDELRISYEPFPEPFVEETMGLDGKMHTLVKNGAMVVKWDSPSGPFQMRWPTQDDATEAYEEMRPYLAMDVAEAYAQAVGAGASKGQRPPAPAT